QARRETRRRLQRGGTGRERMATAGPHRTLNEMAAAGSGRNERLHALRRPTGCVQSAVRASERDADEHRNRSQVGVATNAQRTRLGEHAQAAQPEADARTAGEAELRVRRIILREVRIEAHVVVAYTRDDVRLDHDEWHVEQ